MYEGICPVCEQQISLGAYITSVNKVWVHLSCYPAIDDRRTLGVLAQLPGTCAGCSHPINEGDRMVRQPYFRWAHNNQTCRHAATEWPMPRKRKSANVPAYCVTCPICNAEPDEGCLSTGVQKRQAHQARKRKAQQQQYCPAET